jgi:CRISPR-associated protein Cas1
MRIELMGQNTPQAAKRKPIEVVQAIIEAVSAKRFPKGQSNELPIIFHFNDRKFDFKWRETQPIHLEILFFQTDAQQVEQWKNDMAAYFQIEDHRRTFFPTAIGAVETRDFKTLLSETNLNSIPTEGEMCLDFLSPFPFKRETNKSRLHISRSRFIRGFETRFAKLFGTPFTYRSDSDDFSLLPYYWNYTELRHTSRSHPGHTQYVNGCTGKLYIKGKWEDFLPYVLLGTEIHGGSKRSNSQGYYKLLPDSPPLLDTLFPNKPALRTVFSDILARYDDALESLSRDHMHPFDEEKFALNLFEELKENRYNPTPNTAFVIKRENNTPRLVEQLSIKDLVVSRHLLKTLTTPFNAMMEEESMGYPKGVSRSKAAEMMKAAVRDGYLYMLDTDIESFFSQIDTGKLKKLLENVLPQKDNGTKNILFRIIDNGYRLKGRLQKRLKGIAQGNPLSPMLANLYLDAFDEEIKTLDIRLIRYGDDFIIFFRSKEQALDILDKNPVLSHLGMRLKKDKTAGEVVIQEEAVNMLKKPLYITEPYAMLSLDGEALDIKKDKKIVATIPLRRVSEIMVMEKTLFSTALLKTCTERKIPFTITLNNGYYITTIKPDSKAYFLASHKHASRYAALSDSEILRIAGEFAAGKIGNYISLFKQKYKKGSNQLINGLYDAVSRIRDARSIAAVRGIEKRSSKEIYQGLNRLIDSPLFYLDKRARKEPDRINSLMNFGYYLLFSRINATLRAAGLNPYLGFLHSPADDYESLVCDIQELFRARIDRLIVRLINLGIIHDKDFNDTGRGYYLTREGVKKYLKHFEIEMNKKKQDTLSLKEHIYLQVDILKKWVLENKSLTFYNHSEPP